MKEQLDQSGADETVIIQAPRGATSTIERAAIQAKLTPDELARRLLLDRLRANRFELAEITGESCRFAGHNPLRSQRVVTILSATEPPLSAGGRS